MLFGISGRHRLALHHLRLRHEHVGSRDDGGLGVWLRHGPPDADARDMVAKLCGAGLSHVVGDDDRDDGAECRANGLAPRRTDT